MKTTLKMIVFAALALPLTSQAMVDLRATYGVLPIKSQDACSAFGCPTGALGGIGLDVIISPPLTSFGFGARYESLGLKASANNIDFDVKIDRIALIVNYRLIDTFIHAGPILTYGISNKTSMKGTFGGATTGDYSSTSAESYSIGFELGVKPLIVIPLIVGAEAGLLTHKAKDAKDSVTGATSDLDFSGTYMKAFVGINF